MATADRSVSLSEPMDTTRTAYPAGGWRFDLTVALLCAWFTIGAFVDGYAHNHGIVDNTFFTPWHALLYSGIGAVGMFLALTQYRNVGRGYAWSRALPRGYLMSLVGVVSFFAAGGFDFIWHELFGFEANLEALLSPAHLVLATSGVLISGGPIRAAWGRRQTDAGWRAMLPTLLALLILLSLLTFFTQYASIFTNARLFTIVPPNARYAWDVTAIANVILPALLMIFVILLAIRRWRLPFGALTLLIGVNALLMFLVAWERTQEFWVVLVAALIGGLIGDVLLGVLRPSVERPMALRVFAFAVPFAVVGLALAGLLLRFGIFWSPHMWLGATFTAGIIGLGESYLLIPPALPDDPDAA